VVVGRQFLLRVRGEVEAGRLVGRSLVASNSKPSKVAVALLPGQRASTQIHALALDTAIGVRGALVLVLALRAVEVLFALASRGEVLAISGTGFLEVLAQLDVHIGTGPETIAGGPLIRLAKQPEGAVEALEVVRDLHLIGLGTKKKTDG